MNCYLRTTPLNWLVKSGIGSTVPNRGGCLFVVRLRYDSLLRSKRLAPKLTRSLSSSLDNKEEQTETNQNPENAQSEKPILISPHRPVFPWRHSATTPLPRVCEKNDLSGSLNTWKSRFIQKGFVARELKVPPFQIITAQWENKLAEDLTWTFRRGLSCLLSKTFSVPINKIDDSDRGNVSIDTTTPADQSLSAEEQLDTSDLLTTMLEKTLLNLYQDSTATYQIKFLLRPIHCRLESAFVVPMFNREDVKRKPFLRGAHQAIQKELFVHKSSKRMFEKVQQLAWDTEYSSKRTLIADVSIECWEIFKVIDAITGEIVQGRVEDEEERVTHLVRFEMTTSKEKDKTERELGLWQIIDWDDLLKGNVWH